MHFVTLPNRYAGRVFIRPGTGHLLNQHYLISIFPLNENMCVKENNEFMDMEVKFTIDGAEERTRQEYAELLLGSGAAAEGAVVEDQRLDADELMRNWPAVKGSRKPKVRDFSRLWLYRNGGRPDD